MFFRFCDVGTSIWRCCMFSILAWQSKKFFMPSFMVHSIRRVLTMNRQWSSSSRSCHKKISSHSPWFSFYIFFFLILLWNFFLKLFLKFQCTQFRTMIYDSIAATIFVFSYSIIINLCSDSHQDGLCVEDRWIVSLIHRLGTHSTY